MYIQFVLNRPIDFIYWWYSKSNQLHCLFVNRFNAKWKQISCCLNSIRFFEEKRHVFLPRKSICVTFLTHFLLLHRKCISTECVELADEISSKVSFGVLRVSFIRGWFSPSSILYHVITCFCWKLFKAMAKYCGNCIDILHV